MNNTQSLLFALLRNALWHNEKGLPNELTEKDASLLITVAREQTVSGLIVDAIISNKIKLPQKWVFEAVGIEMQIKQANRALNEEVKGFVRMPLKDYVVVKGQTIATIYPNPLMRMSGDIDFLSYNYHEVKELLEKEWGIELPSKLVDREYTFEHRNATYEIHDQLIVFGNRKHQQFWDELIKRPCGYVSIDGAQIPTLEPTINAIYVFVHLFLHFMREGVSLRQFCDWAIILHHYRDEINKKELIDILLALGLTRAYKAFGSILIDDLGLPSSEFPFELSNDDRKWHERILEDIFKGGNFGKLHHQCKTKWKYKIETFRLALRNSFRYYSLCPSEVGGMIPRLVKVNLRILLS